MVEPGVDLRARIEAMAPLDFVVCDEAQFYEPDQVDQLARVVDELGVDVLELADERQELHVEARCWCGNRATHNARLVDGAQVYDGALKVVGDTVDQSDAEPDQAAFDIETEPVVTYELLCRRHWTRGEATP